MDPIQRKLALIDKQLAGRDFHGRIIRTFPLVFAAVGLIVGILIQETLSGSGDRGRTPFVWFWLAALALLACSAIIVFALQTTGKLRSQAPAILGWLALCCFACLGAIRLISFWQAAPNDIRNFVAAEPKPAIIRGVIVTEPRINRNREWKFARFKPTDPTSSFYLKLTDVKSVTGWAQVSGTVRVQVDEPVMNLKAGDCIEAYCLLDRFKPASNPGQFDTRSYLAGRGVFVAASIKTRDAIEIVESPPAAVFTKLRRKLRQTASQGLIGSLPSDEPSRGLLEALLLGYRGNIDSETYRAFRTTGLLHFVSLSGLHFGVLIGIVWWVCKTAGLLKPGRAVVCIFAITLFLLVVPARAPTVRAAIIGWVFCASFLFRRHSNPTNTLSLAAIILLLIRPTQLFEAGWQLSFATVLGILLFEERIKHMVTEAVDRFRSELDYWQFWRTARVVKKIAAATVPMLSVGLAAWLGGAGILLYHFHAITPLACLWTVLVFPFVGAILTFGFLKIILFFLLPTLSGALSIVVTGLSTALIWIVKLLAHLDLSVLVGHVPTWLVVLYYAFVLFAVFAYFRRPLAKNITCAVFAAVIVVCIVGIKWRRTHHSELVVTCLDVSHGQAIFVELPGGGNLLFDAGSLHLSDVGRRVVAPFLDYKGISRIDALLISHNDIDHINGIPEVAAYCRIDRVYANEAFFENAQDWGAAKFLNEHLAEVGLAIEVASGELNFAGKASVTRIWPGEKSQPNEQLSENDKSLVLSIEFAGKRVLLCSDIEKAAQKEILRLNPGLKADVVIAPHHGSTTTAAPEFLKALEPEILICSCGRREYDRLRKTEPSHKAARFYTPEHGAVTIRISKDGTIRTTTGAQAD